MKYIITESRLDKVIFKYLDVKLNGVELVTGEDSDIRVFILPGEEFGLMTWIGKKSNQLFTYYEIVDGAKKDDVVGVRLKSEGGEGKIFTPADCALLPNPMIP